MSEFSIKKLSLVSYLAPNMFWFYKSVGKYLERVFDIETEILQSQHDPLEDPLLLEDKLDIAFICGLPFIRHQQLIPIQLEVLVAPVMQASRYQNCPVYFSDIIVSTNSKFKALAELGEKTFCYNDRGSNSGYNMLRYQLLKDGYPSNFFGKAIQSGSHQNSIRLVVDGLADCAAIDSTVLEQELRDFPELSDRLRTIASIGPCPMPPVVAAKKLGNTFINQLQSKLLQPDTELQSAMKQAQIQHYAPVQLEDYQAIALMYDAVSQDNYQL